MTVYIFSHSTFLFKVLIGKIVVSMSDFGRGITAVYLDFYNTSNSLTL